MDIYKFDKKNFSFHFSFKFIGVCSYIYRRLFLNKVCIFADSEENNSRFFLFVYGIS